MLESQRNVRKTIPEIHYNHPGLLLIHFSNYPILDIVYI